MSIAELLKEKWLTIAEIARGARVSTKTVHGWIDGKTLPGGKTVRLTVTNFGSIRRVRESDFQRFMEECQGDAT